MVAPELGAPDFELASHAGRERLVIAHPFGSSAFASALALALRLPALDELAPIPVDAALSVRFDDLVSAASIDGAGLAVYGPGGPLAVRVVPDPNHGALVDLDGDGVLEFHPTRATVDPVVSELDRLRSADRSATAVGWLAPGAGPATGSRLDDASALQLVVGPGVVAAAASPADESRRGAGPAAHVFHASAGALGQGGNPRVVSDQLLDVVSVQPFGAGRFALDYGFSVGACALAPSPGDLIRFAGALVEVVRRDVPPVGSGGQFSSVPVQLLGGSAAAVVPGAATYAAPYEPGRDLPECFVSFIPPPASPPAQGVRSDASIRVRFDRRIDQGSAEALKNVTVTRGWTAPALEQLVPGTLSTSPGALVWDGLVRLSTVAPVSPAAYVFDLDGGPDGVLGLNGQPLLDDLPAIGFTLDPNQAAVDSSGIVLELDEVDEDGNGSPELRGQFVRDLAGELIRARPLTRFSAHADQSNTTVAAMVPFANGVQTPLSALGSKLMSLWRYHDLGFSLLDETYHNLDVEGLWWSPVAGQVISDTFAEFQMALGHSSYLPDEAINTALLPSLPNSGVSNTYDQNYLEPQGGAVVHPKTAGYQVNPLDRIQSPGGTYLMPWPLNREVPLAQYTYWTWRDTGVTEVGAPNGVGADTKVLNSLVPGASQGLYRVDEVPTIGLPLLTEFRTYSDVLANGLNSLNVSIAINSSALPYFRTFSTGGVLLNGNVLVVDPDQELTGSGGVTGTGIKTQPRDNTFYIGQADFVVRVSRLHTVWFDTGGNQLLSPAVIEPAAQFQPPGTSVEIAYRGADDITSVVPGIWGTTKWLDAYGDSYDQAQLQKLTGSPGQPDESFSVSFFNGDGGWKQDVSELDGARYLQARVTLISNPETGATPTVTGLGFGYER